jgi:hypothetical protein
MSFSDLLVSVVCGKEGDYNTFGSKLLGELHHGSYVTLRWVWKHKNMQLFGIASHLIFELSATTFQGYWVLQDKDWVRMTKLKCKRGTEFLGGPDHLFVQKIKNIML